MTDHRLLREEDFESPVLREAAAKLNLIYRLASAYRAPDLLEFLDRLASSLAKAEEHQRAGFVSRN